MSSDMLAQAGTKVVVIVFGMNGCPACGEYLPRFFQQVEGFQKLGHPFVIYSPGHPVGPKQIPIIVLDSESNNDQVQFLANHHGVSALPTTIIQPKVGYPAKYEGSLSDQEIYQLLSVAVLTNR